MRLSVLIRKSFWAQFIGMACVVLGGAMGLLVPENVALVLIGVLLVICGGSLYAVGRWNQHLAIEVVNMMEERFNDDRVA